MLLSCISTYDERWSASNEAIYSVFAGLIIVHRLCAIFSGTIMPKIWTISIFANFILLLATEVALRVRKVRSASHLKPSSLVAMFSANVMPYKPVEGLGNVFWNSFRPFGQPKLSTRVYIWGGGVACCKGGLVRDYLLCPGLPSELHPLCGEDPEINDRTDSILDNQGHH